MAGQRGRRERGDEWKRIRKYIVPGGRETANITGRMNKQTNMMKPPDRPTNVKDAIWIIRNME